MVGERGSNGEGGVSGRCSGDRREEDEEEEVVEEGEEVVEEVGDAVTVTIGEEAGTSV